MADSISNSRVESAGELEQIVESIYTDTATHCFEFGTVTAGSSDDDETRPRVEISITSPATAVTLWASVDVPGTTMKSEHLLSGARA